MFGSEVWFDSLTMFISFLLGGRWLELRARHRAEQSLESRWASCRRRRRACGRTGSSNRSACGAWRWAIACACAVGEAFAADGVLIDGQTRADEALLSGESRPVRQGAGDEVVAGSVNIGAPVLMRVQRVGADTRFEAVVALMRGARSQRPAVVAAADRWAAPFLWRCWRWRRWRRVVWA